MCEVSTARWWTKDPDRFDITRGSGNADGLVFAPSWEILGPALRARDEATKSVDIIATATAEVTGGRVSAEDRAIAIRDLMRDEWARYVPTYTREMRESYRASRDTWEWLLGRPRVVLVCKCADVEQCHRTILARDILPKLGATYAGELS